MKDTTNHEALSKAHENLSDDLASVSQLIAPENQQALAKLYQAQRRLADVQELLKHATKPATSTELDDDNASRGLVGLFTDDTLAYVRDALAVLCHVSFEDCGSDNDFKCGMIRILNCAMEALEYEVGRVAALRKAAPAA